MIVRRGGTKKRRVGVIVRRSQPTVGARRGGIVRRGAPPAGPGTVTRLAGWRPGRGVTLIAAALAVVVMLAGAATFAWRSSFFEIDSIEVVGNHRIAAAEIAARTDLMGQRIFTADLESAQTALYALPLVSDVRIERVWPDGVRVIVVERQPWGSWQQDGVTYTIDRDGVVIGTTPPPAGSPVIVSNETGSRKTGDRVDYQAVDAAAELYQRLPEELGTQVTEVRFLGPGGVQVTTADGQVAYLGDSGGMSYKLEAWAAIAAEAKRLGITYEAIDLRYGNRPVLQ